MDFIFPALHKFEYRDKFIHMIKVEYTNTESKIKTKDLLSDPLTLMLVCQGCRLSMLLYNIAAELLTNLINADKRIKGTQIGDDEIKTLNFADNTTIILRDITCVNRMHVILKLYENAEINYLNDNLPQR